MLPSHGMARDTIKLAFLTADPSQMQALSSLADRFEQAYPEHVLEVHAYSDLAFKENLTTWLEQGTFDVVHWQAGGRLFSVVDKGLAWPINDLVGKPTLENLLPDNISRQVAFGEQIYALPFAQYSWGFYYNKAVFARLGLTPPTTWDAFLEVCRVLHENGIAPLIQANNEQWEPHAWLDFLSIKNGGLPVRKSLLSQQAASNPDASGVLADLEYLFSRNYFFASNHSWRWQQTIAVIMRQQAAMTLTGQFVEKALSDSASETLGFFPFPSVQDKATVAPMDVLFIPASSNHKAAAGKFLQFLAAQERLLELATNLGWLPVVKGGLSKDTFSERQKTAIRHMRQAPALVQYFDRDTTAEWSLQLDSAFDEAFATQNISALKQALNGNSPSVSRIDLMSEGPNTMHFASLTGHRGSFLASRFLRKVYRDLGYNFSVTRFPTTEASRQSLQFGMDGELARVGHYGDGIDNLVRVPEPLLTVGAYMLHNAEGCRNVFENNDAINIGVASDAIYFSDWATKTGVSLRSFIDHHAVWQALKTKDIQGAMMFEPEYREYMRINPDSDICAERVDEVAFYHFLHTNHQDLVQDVAARIRALKQDKSFVDVLREFGVRNRND